MTTKRQPRVPTLCRHKATGQAVVRLDGKDRYCGAWGTGAARARYDRLIGQWLANGRALPAVTDAPITVVELADRYLEHCDQHYRRLDGTPSSEATCVSVAMRPLLALFGRTPAREFGPRTLLDVREAMLGQVTRFGRLPARVTVNGNVRRITRMFRWAVQQELVPAEVWQSLRSVEGLRAGRSAARETERVRPLQELQIESVLPHLSRHVGALVQLMALTGMRVGEAVTMRMNDLDCSGDVWLYRPGHHKTEHRGRQRIVALGPKAQEVLKPFLRAGGGYLFQPAEAEQERNAKRREARVSPMTPSQAARSHGGRRSRSPGEHYTTASLRRAVGRACDDAGIPNWTPGRLRHTVATRLRRQYGLEVSRVMLGHSSPVVTEEFYAEADQLKAVEIARQAG